MSTQQYFKDRQIDLDLWQFDQKINRKHLFSRGIHCVKFCNFLAKRSRDFEQTTFFQRQAVWPWPLSMWLENQNGYLFLMGIHSFKFGNFQAKILRRDHTLHQVWQLSRKRSKDIEWTSLGLQKDSASFSKGNIKYEFLKICIVNVDASS